MIDQYLRCRVRKLRNDGLKLCVIAERLGLSVSSVSEALGKPKVRTKEAPRVQSATAHLKGIPHLPDDVLKLFDGGRQPSHADTPRVDAAILEVCEKIREARWAGMHDAA